MASDEKSIHPWVVSHRGLQLHCDARLGVLVLDDGQPQRVRPLVARHGLHHLKVRGAELPHRVGFQQAGQHRQHAVAVEYRVRGRPDNKGFFFYIAILHSSSIPEPVDVLEVWKAR